MSSGLRSVHVETTGQCEVNCSAPGTPRRNVHDEVHKLLSRKGILSSCSGILAYLLQHEYSLCHFSIHNGVGYFRMAVATLAPLCRN